MYVNDPHEAGLGASPTRDAMIATVGELFPGRPIIWCVTTNPAANQGMSRVLSAHLEVWFSLHRGDMDPDQHRVHLDYVVAHELGHLIVRGREYGAYIDFAALREAYSPELGAMLARVTSTLEHPLVHSVMLEFGYSIPDIGEDYLDELLAGKLEANLDAIAEGPPDFNSFQFAIWLIEYQTAYKSDRSAELARRMEAAAPAFAQTVRACVAVVDRFATGADDSLAACTAFCKAIGQPGLAHFFIGYDRWVASLASS